MNFIFPYIGNVIIPIDYYTFQMGGSTTSQFLSLSLLEHMKKAGCSCSWIFIPKIWCDTNAESFAWSHGQNMVDILITIPKWMGLHQYITHISDEKRTSKGERKDKTEEQSACPSGT